MVGFLLGCGGAVVLAALAVASFCRFSVQDIAVPMRESSGDSNAMLL
jgi:hypothetical protein